MDWNIEEEKRLREATNEAFRQLSFAKFEFERFERSIEILKAKKLLADLEHDEYRKKNPEFIEGSTGIN